MFTKEEFLGLAPCPPVWNKALFWKATSTTNLTEEEINVIVDKCDIPLDFSRGATVQAGVTCSLTCVILCSVLGGMLLFLLGPVALVWW